MTNESSAIKTVDVQWLGPKQVGDGGVEGGGIYLWFDPEFDAVVYVGEAADYRKRLVQQIATSIGYGGSCTTFQAGDDPYDIMRNYKKAVDDGKILPPWTMEECLKQDFLKGLKEHRPKSSNPIIERVDLVLKYFAKVRILYGVISDTSINRKEIEGGIIHGLKETKELATYRGSNNTVIGTISKYPTKQYCLYSADDSEPEADKCAKQLLADFTHDGGFLIGANRP